MRKDPRDFSQLLHTITTERTPCETCMGRVDCYWDKLACNDFLNYVNKGDYYWKRRTPSKKATREGYNEIFTDQRELTEDERAEVDSGRGGSLGQGSPEAGGDQPIRDVGTDL